MTSYSGRYSPFKDSRGSKDKHEMKPETALRQLPEWGRTFQQRETFQQRDRSPFPGRERISASGGKEEGQAERKRDRSGKEEGQVRRNSISIQKGDRSPERGQVDKASRTSNPTFVSISFRPGVRITERRLFPAGPIKKEFLHREFLGFFQALGGNGCTKSHENRKPWRSMRPIHWTKRSKSKGWRI